MKTLRRQRDLDRAFQEGRWRRLQTVSVGLYLRGDEHPPRVAFVAGQRVGTAVRRNRARRRLRNAFQTLDEQVRPGVDIVLVARGATVDADFEAIQRDIRQALSSEGLLMHADAGDRSP